MRFVGFILPVIILFPLPSYTHPIPNRFSDLEVIPSSLKELEWVLTFLTARVKAQRLARQKNT